MGRSLRKAARQAIAWLPRGARHQLLRRLIRIDPDPDARLQVRIAESREDLEACFRLLHDAYVGSGYMQPEPSGMRVTRWHALPTTTTIAATWDGEVVGTMSLIREGVFGFPLQSVFDLSSLRTLPGRVAEVSALAIAPRFRAAGGPVLFPLMKFMYAYCTRYFDTRHLVIAVNPAMADLYEAVLLFRRLPGGDVQHYGFANGAPAVGATLDLSTAPERFAEAYGGRAADKDLHHYFVHAQLPHLQLPARPIFTTNDPVMTPALLDHFFNHRCRVFDRLDARQRVLLHAIYGDERYREVLPPLAPGSMDREPRRQHPRHSIKCPAQLQLGSETLPAMVVEMSTRGLQLLADRPLPAGAIGTLSAHLGQGLHARVDVAVVRRTPTPEGHWYGLRVDRPDEAWLACVQRLERSQTYRDLAQPAPSAPPGALPLPA